MELDVDVPLVILLIFPKKIRAWQVGIHGFPNALSIHVLHEAGESQVEVIKLSSCCLYTAGGVHVYGQTLLCFLQYCLQVLPLCLYSHLQLLLHLFIPPILHIYYTLCQASKNEKLEN
nr:hypothetical protein Itr_chr01CG19430 [Ipomoea trifida]GMC50225.1 hypothetical protein Iba_chr01bCG15080 [Ipomoea batatas]